MRSQAIQSEFQFSGGSLLLADLLGSRAMKYDVGKMLLVADLAGTLLFGIEGADAAIRGNLDLLGMMVCWQVRRRWLAAW